MSGFSSAKLNVQQEVLWLEFWQGGEGDLSREGSDNPFQQVCLTTTQQGTIQCLELLSACAREASASDPIILGIKLPQEESNEAHRPEWLQRNHP